MSENELLCDVCCAAEPEGEWTPTVSIFTYYPLDPMNVDGGSLLICPRCRNRIAKIGRSDVTKFARCRVNIDFVNVIRKEFKL